MNAKTGLVAVFCIAVMMATLEEPVAQASDGLSMSTIEIRITDHKPGIADFKELFVGLASISIHSAGSGKREGWVELSTDTPLIDIVPLKDGVYTTLGNVEVPAVAFDAVKIEFAQISSELLSGEDAVVTWDDTIVAKDIDMKTTTHRSLVVDLYAENQNEHVGGGYVVKVKEIRLDEQ